MTSQTPAGTSTGAVGACVVRRPCTFPAAARASASVSARPTTHRVRRRRPRQRVRPARCHRRSRPAPSTTSGPTRWGTPPSSAARRDAAARSRPVAGRRERSHPPVRRSQASKIVRQPGAAAQVGEQRPADRAVGRPGPAGPPAAQCLEPHDDARGAEPALARPARQERLGPGQAVGLREAVERRDHPAGHPPQRRDAGDPGLAVDQDRATAALALGAAAVLHGAGPEAVPQGLRQRAAVVVDSHAGARRR